MEGFSRIIRDNAVAAITETPSLAQNGLPGDLVRRALLKLQDRLPYYQQYDATTLEEMALATFTYAVRETFCEVLQEESYRKVRLGNTINELARERDPLTPEKLAGILKKNGFTLKADY